MKVKIFFLWVVLGLFSTVAAEEKNFFGLEKVDFFGKEKAAEEKLPRQENSETIKKTEPAGNTVQEKPPVIEDEWAEPVVDSTGKTQIHLPPEKVRNFLNDPSEDNAKVYLEWNVERLKKLSKAQKALEKAAKDIGYVTNNTIKPAKANGGSRLSIKKDYMVYFMLKGCSACKKQGEAIAEIYQEHPGIAIESYGKGFTEDELKGYPFPVKMDIGVSKALKIDTFPTLLVFNKKGEKFWIYGYKTKEELLALF